MLSHLLLIKGTHVLWTIGPEIQFYLFFAVIWWLSLRREANAYLMMALVFAMLFFAGFPRPRGEVMGLPYDLPIFRSLPYFFAGVILGRIYTAVKLPEIQSGWFVCVLLVIPLLYPKVFVGLTGHKHGMWDDMGLLMMMALVFSAVLFLVPDRNPLMANRLGDFLGRISYSL